MTSAPSSLEAAFRHAAHGGGVIGVDPDPQQLDMLRDEDGRLPANVFRLVRDGKAVKGRGRPRGAGNKRNAKLAKLICQEHGDPVMFMSSVYAMPLDQLVELLKIADGSADVETRLLDVIDECFALVRSMRGIMDNRQLNDLCTLLGQATAAATSLKAKPGELALRALGLQIQAAREVGPYVHGKQPIAIDVTAKTDAVLIIPGINAPLGVNHADLKAAIDQGGLDRLDFDTMQLLPPSEADDAEFEEIDEQGDPE